jgi:hypothetical protein
MAAARKKKGEGDEESRTITLRRLEKHYVDILIAGEAPIISHKWDEKARRQMPGQPDSGIETKKNDLHRPAEEAWACLHHLGDDEPAVPAVSAARRLRRRLVQGARLAHGEAPADPAAAFQHAELKEDSDGDLRPAQQRCVLLVPGPRHRP